MVINIELLAINLGHKLLKILFPFVRNVSPFAFFKSDLFNLGMPLNETKNFFFLTVAFKKLSLPLLFRLLGSDKKK